MVVRLLYQIFVGRPLQTSFAFTNGALVPAPASPATPVVPSVGKPFKFVLASSKVIASWFGIACEYVFIPQNTQMCLAIIKEYYKHGLSSTYSLTLAIVRQILVQMHF